MNKILTISWIIIISGSIFIAINRNKTDNKAEDTNTIEISKTDNTNTTTNTSISEKPSTKIKHPANIIPEITAPKRTYTEHIAIGDSYLQNGYIDKAIAEYYAASKSNSKSIEPLKKLGEAYLENNQGSLALETFNKAAKISPNSIEIFINIARAYISLNDIESAKNLVWQLDQNNIYVKYYSAIILILYNDLEGAKNHFSEIANTVNIEDQNLKIKAEKFLEDYELFDYFTEEETVYLKLLLAKTLTELNEYKASIPLLFKIIEEKNNYRDAWIVLGYAYLKTNQIPDAIDTLKQAKDIDPEKADTLFFLGLSYFANNETDKAIYYLEQASDLNFQPKDLLKMKLGDLYLLKKEYKKSAKNYEEVIAINPINLDMFVRSTWIYIEQLDKPKKALEISKKAVENFPEKGMSYNLVGWSYLAANKNNEAKEYFLIALDLNPNLDATHLNLGILYEKEKLINLAKEEFIKAYKLGNGNSITEIAAIKYNSLNTQELNNNIKANLTRQ